MFIYLFSPCFHYFLNLFLNGGVDIPLKIVIGNHCLPIFSPRQEVHHSLLDQILCAHATRFCSFYLCNFWEVCSYFKLIAKRWKLGNISQDFLRFFNIFAYFYFVKHREIDILLLRCCTRFSCTLIKWYLQLAKITIPPPYSERMKLPINEFHCGNLNWRQIFPC